MHEAYRRYIAGRGEIPDLLPDYLNRIGEEKFLEPGQEIRLSRQTIDVMAGHGKPSSRRT